MWKSQRAGRYSVNALYSMAAENDTDIEDDLAKGGLSPPGRTVSGS
jgi:hypothetical protein